ncbi:hypothetical protein JCM19233_5366 [Vibrio astriarenae]|nr:hypothetical protein JCM19233_5366 [Vibrio sp. C7]
MKSNNKHIKKESEKLDVFNIDPRTLGRPLNIAKANLTPNLHSIEDALAAAINAMVRRSDCHIELKSLSIEMKPTKPLHSAACFYQHTSHQGVCRLEVNHYLLTQLAEAFYGGKLHLVLSFQMFLSFALTPVKNECKPVLGPLP